MTLWLPGSYVGQVHPSGMNASAFRKLDRMIDRSGFQRIGYKDTPQGRILVAEKREMKHGRSYYRVLWACREFACYLECNPSSSRGQRFEAAIEHAEKTLLDRKAVGLQ